MISKKTRVLVVDDSAFSRQTIKKMLEKDPNIEVAGLAADGIDAIAKTLRFKPDLITLDFEMPEMDGFSFLRWLMKQQPTPVIMVSSYSDSKTVFKALELGAVDFISKPSKKASLELQGIENDLLKKVHAVENLKMDRLNKNLKLLSDSKSPVPVLKSAARNIDVVAIGSSTGGPTALQIILAHLPHDFMAGIVISQHMPKGFTASLAERIDKLSQVRVKEAAEGDLVEKGKVLICPGGYHMRLNKRGQNTYVSIKPSSPEDKYIPSIDTMMISASEIHRDRAMGIVLTGMGNDGKKGMLEIKSRGGYTIAESEETAIVFGMPAEAIHAGAADKVLPLQEISSEMIRMVREE